MEILFTGDVNFRGHDALTPARARTILREVLPLTERADLVAPNLECPLARAEGHQPIHKAGPNLICAPENLCFLQAMRAGVVTLANNHTGDYGPEAVQETIDLLEGAHILHAGAGENIEAAYRAARIEKNGRRAAIVSVCENEFGLATETQAGSAGYSPRRLLRQIRAEKEAGCAVIVVFHGGNEHNPLPSPDTVERYRMICDMGADAVIATHTHCPQGYEIYCGKPIVYSMGNFLFKSEPQRSAEDAWHYGYMSRLTMGEDGRFALETLPYRFTPAADCIHVFSGGERAAMQAYLEGLSEIIQQEETLKSYFKGWAWLHPWVPVTPDNWETLEGFYAAGQYDLIKCEAHASQMRALFEVFFNGEMKLAQEMGERVRALQKMPVGGAD